MSIACGARSPASARDVLSSSAKFQPSSDGCGAAGRFGGAGGAPAGCAQTGTADASTNSRQRERGAGGLRRASLRSPRAAAGAACATRRALFLMARVALVMVIVALDTASMSPPTLNGSRMFLPLNCAANVGRFDREIAVRLVVLDDDDASEDAFGVHADEHLDRAVVAALERLELGRPENEARQRLLARRILDERLEMRQGSPPWARMRSPRGRAA